MPFRKVVAEESNADAKGAVSSDVQTVVYELIQAEPLPFTFDAREVPAAIRTAMRLLELEQVSTPSIEDLARRVGLSAAHFSRLFAASLGQTSASYGRRIRLDHAANRMMFDPAPLKDVARLFGFEGQAAFNRAFRRQHGTSPRACVAGLRAARSGPHKPELEPAVTVIERTAEPALARRFFGSNLDAHWRQFRAELPEPLARVHRQAGLLYDLPAVTPPQYRRYDCAIPVRLAGGINAGVAATAGLDPIELPGGIHAEVSGCATIAEVSATIGFLYRTWLPAHSGFAPEGDPMVHWRVAGDEHGFITTIRLRRIADTPVWNLMPLNAAMEPIGTR